jgi:hypothetical protein
MLIFCGSLGSIAILSGLRLGLWLTHSDNNQPGNDAPSVLETSSIDLTSGGGDATLSASNMVPGDAVTAAITMTNSGSRPMTYSMSSALASAGGEALSAALVLTVKTVGSSCADFDGTTLFDGPLAAAGFGSQDNGRPLPGATAEILCFRASLPQATGNALQGKATAVTFTFGATVRSAAR